MMSTEIATTSPLASAGGGPTSAHTPKATTAMTMTARTNQPATRSASFWTGARVRPASATICTMRASSVSEPTFSARISKEPV